MNQTRLRLIRFSKGIGEIWNAPCPVNILASCFSVLGRDSFRQRRSPPPAWCFCFQLSSQPYSSIWNWVILKSSLKVSPWHSRLLEQLWNTCGPNLGCYFAPCSVMSSQWMCDHDIEWFDGIPKYTQRPRVRRLQTKTENEIDLSESRPNTRQSEPISFGMTWTIVALQVSSDAQVMVETREFSCLCTNSRVEYCGTGVHVRHSRIGYHSSLFALCHPVRTPNLCLFC